MPRLLLVDDNPSIHKIAETLLANSDFELVCLDRAQEALARIQAGEAFDVALIDTHMAGMDGWELLDQLRRNPATARLPIALMAGVLDQVDPARVEAAPIQGFLKKPVELRDLAERVRSLMAVPVPEPAPVPPSPSALEPEPSAFVTLPSVKLADLLEPHAEPLLPSDLLILSEADVLPDAAAPTAGQATYEVPVETLGAEEALDLEELDLESLKGLSLQTEAAETPVQELSPVVEPEPSMLDFTPPGGFQVMTPEPAAPAAERAVSEELGEEAPEEIVLPDLGPSADLSDSADVLDLGAPEVPELLEAGTPEIEEAPLPVDWSDDSDTLLDALHGAQTGPFGEAPAGPVVDPDLERSLAEPDDTLPEVAVPVSATLPLCAPQAEPVMAFDLPETEPGDAVSAPAPVPAAPAQSLPAEALVQALLADPAAMDALAKALVARLGEQTLREIAWELLPDLAQRLERP